ncbi:MAG: chemoreceptor glutamine deamidase CheD [Gammaproteobacteria bacterium]
MGSLAGPGESLSPGLPGFEAVNRYWDRTHNATVAKILPGEYYVTTADELIVTVLGSCVSACIRDRVFGIGGMNHFMLPARGGSSRPGQSLPDAAARYGNYAMELLVNTILKNGGSRRNMEVKIFGGGRVLAQLTDVGRRNIDFVREYIETENLALVAEDVGDRFPRKVVYCPKTGRVRVKRLRVLHNDTVLKRENNYLRDLESGPVAGEIELF